MTESENMAAIFCLFSVTLCKFSGNEAPGIANNLIKLEHNNNVNNVNQKDLTLPLSAQLVTVPRIYISPCPETFRFTFNGKEWFGLVVISKPARIGIPSRTRVVLSVGFNLSAVS